MVHPKIKEIWQYDMQLSTGDMDVLSELVTKRAPKLVVEVGSWKGLSTGIIALNPSVDEVFCVDTWAGATNTPGMQDEARARNIYNEFWGNMQALGVAHKIRTLHMDSRVASRIFRGQIADMVFIDCDHSYTAVCRDIFYWRMAVKAGGILAGHDLECRWSALPMDTQWEILQRKEDDFLVDFLGKGHGIHPGVTRAIFEQFNDDVNQDRRSSIWWKDIQ